MFKVGTCKSKTKHKKVFEMIHVQGFCTTNGRSLDFGLSGYIQSTYCTMFWIFLGFASDSDMLGII